MRTRTGSRSRRRFGVRASEARRSAGPTRRRSTSRTSTSSPPSGRTRGSSSSSATDATWRFRSSASRSGRTTSGPQRASGRAGSTWAPPRRPSAVGRARADGSLRGSRHGSRDARCERLCDVPRALDFEPDMLAIEHTDASKVVEGSGRAGSRTSGPGSTGRRSASGEDHDVAPPASTSSTRSPGRSSSAWATSASPVDGRSGKAEIAGYRVHDAAMRGVNFVRLRLVQERGREVGYVLKRKLARVGH